MSDTPHVHQLDWATEGPLWFCKCGAEFFLEVSKPPTQPVIVDTRKSMRPRKHAIRVRSNA